LQLRKYYAVSITLVCLLISCSAHAQFGKLKSLANGAKDKVTSAANNKVESTVNDKTDAALNKAGLHSTPAAQSANKGAVGEAKAVFAPGVNKSLDVSRKSSGTPEANIAAVAGGRPQDVTIKISNMDARKFDGVRGYSPCNKISNFKILSATQMKVTIDLTGNKSDATCSLYFTSGGNTVFASSVSVKGSK
jgi:hypothetical protein